MNVWKRLESYHQVFQVNFKLFNFRASLSLNNLKTNNPSYHSWQISEEISISSADSFNKRTFERSVSKEDSYETSDENNHHNYYDDYYHDIERDGKEDIKIYNLKTIYIMNKLIMISKQLST